MPAGSAAKLQVACDVRTKHGLVHPPSCICNQKPVLVVKPLEVRENVTRHLRDAGVDVLVWLITRLRGCHLDGVDDSGAVDMLYLELGVFHQRAQ